MSDVGGTRGPPPVLPPGPAPVQRTGDTGGAQASQSGLQGQGTQTGTAANAPPPPPAEDPAVVLAGLARASLPPGRTLPAIINLPPGPLANLPGAAAIIQTEQGAFQILKRDLPPALLAALAAGPDVQIILSVVADGTDMRVRLLSMGGQAVEPPVELSLARLKAGDKVTALVTGQDQGGRMIASSPAGLLALPPANSPRLPPQSQAALANIGPGSSLQAEIKSVGSDLQARITAIGGKPVEPPIDVRIDRLVPGLRLPLAPGGQDSRNRLLVATPAGTLVLADPPENLPPALRQALGLPPQANAPQTASPAPQPAPAGSSPIQTGTAPTGNAPAPSGRVAPGPNQTGTQAPAAQGQAPAPAPMTATVPALIVPNGPTTAAPTALASTPSQAPASPSNPSSSPLPAAPEPASASAMPAPRASAIPAPAAGAATSATVQPPPSSTQTPPAGSAQNPAPTQSPMPTQSPAPVQAGTQGTGMASMAPAPPSETPRGGMVPTELFRLQMIGAEEAESGGATAARLAAHLPVTRNPLGAGQNAPSGHLQIRQAGSAITAEFLAAGMPRPPGGGPLFSFLLPPGPLELPLPERAGGSELARALERLSLGWPALDDATRSLGTAAPELERLLVQNIPPLQSHATPVSPAKLGEQILAWLAGMRGGDAAAWLGRSITQSLEAQGKRELIRRLSEDMQSLSRIADQPTPEWRALPIPFHDGREVKMLPIFIARRQNEPEETDEKPGQRRDKKRQDPGVRFLMTVDLSALGDVQFDGLVRAAEKRFDLVIRSHKPLADVLKAEILELFQQSGGAMGFQGQLAFQAIKPFPVSPMEAIEQSGGRGPAVLI